MDRGIITMIAAAVAGCGTGAAQGPAVPAASAEQPSEVVYDRVTALFQDRCQSHNCGSNSAQVNGTPLGALRLDGTPNAAGFSIDPALHPPRGEVDPVPLHVEVQHGELVGADASGEAVISGDQLAGRWFRIAHRTTGGIPRTTSSALRIVRVGYVRTMADRAHDVVHAPEPGGPRVPTIDPVPFAAKREIAVGYEVEFTADITTKPQGQNVCARPVSLVAPGVAQRARLPAAPALEGVPEIARKIPLDTPVSFVFAVAGERYDDATGAVARDKADSFNLACPGTALSKMKLMGYDPQDTRYPTSADQRQAVLRMITARYCGDTSFTFDHQPVLWDNRQGWFAWSTRDQLGPIEALWDKDGARCLDEPRVPGLSRERVVKECEGKRELVRCDPAVNLHDLPPGVELVTITVPPP